VPRLCPRPSRGVWHLGRTVGAGPCSRFGRPRPALDGRSRWRSALSRPPAWYWRLASGAALAAPSGSPGVQGVRAGGGSTARPARPLGDHLVYGLSRAAPGGRTCSTRERAVVRFATLLTSHPGADEQRDLDELGAQLSTEKVFELVMAIATANWANRFNDGLGLRSADPSRRRRSKDPCALLPLRRWSSATQASHPADSRDSTRCQAAGRGCRWPAPVPIGAGGRRRARRSAAWGSSGSEASCLP
jgi:alkylhydroperoxidase family enzyme